VEAQAGRPPKYPKPPPFPPPGPQPGPEDPRENAKPWVSFPLLPSQAPFWRIFPLVESGAQGHTSSSGTCIVCDWFQFREATECAGNGALRDGNLGTSQRVLRAAGSGSTKPEPNLGDGINLSITFPLVTPRVDLPRPTPAHRLLPGRGESGYFPSCKAVSHRRVAGNRNPPTPEALQSRWQKQGFQTPPAAIGGGDNSPPQRGRPRDPPPVPSNRLGPGPRQSVGARPAQPSNLGVSGKRNREPGPGPETGLGGPLVYLDRGPPNPPGSAAAPATHPIPTPPTVRRFPAGGRVLWALGSRNASTPQSPQKTFSSRRGDAGPDRPNGNESFGRCVPGPCKPPFFLPRFPRAPGWKNPSIPRPSTDPAKASRPLCARLSGSRGGTWAGHPTITPGRPWDGPPGG